MIELFIKELDMSSDVNVNPNIPVNKPGKLRITKKTKNMTITNVLFKGTLSTKDVRFQSIDDPAMSINLDPDLIDDVHYTFIDDETLERFQVFSRPVSYVINPRIRQGMILLASNKDGIREYVCVVDQIENNTISMRALNINKPGGKPETLEFDFMDSNWRFEEVR